MSLRAKRGNPLPQTLAYTFEHCKYILSRSECQETFGNFFERNIAKAKQQRSVALSDLLFITATYCRSFLLLKQKKDRTACADSDLSIPPFLVQGVIYKKEGEENKWGGGSLSSLTMHIH